MKHILNKKISESTNQELLLTLMHTNGMTKGPTKIIFAEPVMETLIEIDSDRTAIIYVFEEDIETLKSFYYNKQEIKEEFNITVQA